MKTETNNPWALPVEVSQLDMAFGGAGGLEKYMPAYADIPKEFKGWNGKWQDVQSKWFYTGLPEGTKFIAKEGVDVTKALRHLKTVQGSFQPKHEHKTAAVSYLMSLWFTDVVYPAKS